MKSYDAGGAAGLVDEVNGQVNWRMGNWQGYQNQKLDAVVDLKKTERIEKMKLVPEWTEPPEGSEPEKEEEPKEEEPKEPNL